MHAMAAIMESFDAQMMDYHNDGDVQMQTSHETWFQEATMEDDGPQVHGETHSTSTEFEDVEIDMEENLAEISQNPEYEMVDEDGEFDYPVADAEEDVIVHDVSHPLEPSASTVSDFHQPPDHSTSFSSQEPALNQHEPSLTLFDSIQVGEDSADIADNHDTSSTTVESEPLAHADLPLSEAFQVPTVEDVGGTSVDNENATVSSTDVAKGQVSSELLGSLVQKEQGAGGDGDPLTTSQVVAPATELSHLREESTADLDHDDLHVAGSQTHEVLVNEEVIVGSPTEEESEAPLHEDGTGAIPTQHDHNPETEISLVDATADQNETITVLASSDYLELSEAALLDPPPGVLLSFADADHPEVSLFSQPNHPETSSAIGNSYKLVFEDNPSLYYESLSALFDALRQNEFVTSLHDLSLSELVIDAFDLQLTISEDNIFSRETSLYDLYQLHDGSGFSGPLRLRLKSTSPRFIVRYRLLQDQIYRLELAAQEEYSEQVEGHDTVEEQNTMPDPETESTEEPHTDELTYVENPGDDLEHNYNASFEEQEEDIENESENPHAAIPDAVAAEELVRGVAGSEATERNKIDQGHEEVDESNTETVETSSLKADTDHVTTATTTLPTQGIDEIEEPHDETANNGEDHANGVEDENKHNAEEPEQTTEDEQEKPISGGSENSSKDEETQVAHESIGLADDAKPDENYTEHGNDDESYAANTDEWDDTFDDDGGLDTTFEEGEEEELVAGESVNTISSKSSKRSIDEVEAEGAGEMSLPLDSPGSKRLRVD